MNINLIIFLIIVACVLSFILGVYVANMSARNTYFYCKNKMMKQAIKIQDLRIKEQELKLIKLNQELTDVEAIELKGEEVKSFEEFLKTLNKAVDKNDSDEQNK